MAQSVATYNASKGHQRMNGYGRYRKADKGQMAQTCGQILQHAMAMSWTLAIQKVRFSQRCNLEVGGATHGHSGARRYLVRQRRDAGHSTASGLIFDFGSGQSPTPKLAIHRDCDIRNRYREQ
jgi:hypothetical protein